MSVIRGMSEERRQELRAASRQNGDAGLGRRALGVLLFAQGKQYPEICRMLSVSKEALRLWLRRYEAGGVSALATQRKPGRPARLMPQIKPIVAELVHQSPQGFGYLETTWTVGLLRQHLAHNHGLQAGLETVRRALVQLGLRWNRAKHTISSPDPEYEAKKGFGTSLWLSRRPTRSSCLRTRRM